MLSTIWNKPTTTKVTGTEDVHLSSTFEPVKLSYADDDEELLLLLPPNGAKKTYGTCGPVTASPKP